MQEKVIQEKDEYKVSRVLYIIEAALEYFVSLMVGSVYLAKITKYIGISDAVTGILTSFLSLGCGFQIVAVFLSKYRPVKKWVTVLHTVSQLMFGLLYIIPLLKISVELRTVLFIIMLLSAHVIHNIINAPKINWFMSLVDDSKRGKFTANKEMISLAGGIVVSYLLGLLMDYFEDLGQIETAFTIFSLGILALMILHTLTLIFSKEKPVTEKEKAINSDFKVQFKGLLKNKTILKIVLVATLWNIAQYSVVPFLGAYQVNDLGFSTSFAMIITIVASVARIIFSRPFGAFADKYSFSKMLCICFSIEAVAFGVCAFANPANGSVVLFIFYILYFIGQAGTYSSLTNLIYDYVEPNQRMSAIAVNQTLYGFAGFFTTLVCSPILASIQANGNKVFGIPMYGQQFLAIIATVLTIAVLCYVIFVVNRIDKKERVPFISIK